MASPTPVLDRRVAPHSSRSHLHSDTATALQGAVSAFHASPSRGVSPVATHRSGASMRVAGASRSLGPVPHPNVESGVPPEVGSVRDKIGRLASNSHQPSLQNTSESHHGGAIDSKQRSLQQIAAQLAAGKSSLPGEKTTPAGGGMAQDAARFHQRRNPERQDIDLLTGVSLGNPAPRRESSARISLDEQTLPYRKNSLQRKPVQTSPTVLDHAQLAAKNARPIPPVPPRSRSVAAKPSSSSASIRSIQTRPYEDSLSTHSSIRSKASSSLSDEKAPPLPARPGRPPVARKDIGDHRQLLEKAGSPRRALSPASTYSRSYANSSSSLLDMDEGALSDAIAASSLASRRASPARKVPPPPPPQRRPRSRSILHMHHSGKNEHESPSTTMRHTLRDPPKPEDPSHDDRHRRHVLRKHPHKHHEGDRKRWRSEVTEKERKRYEGVWAANKGLLIATDPSGEQFAASASDMVVNVVVRDVWSRSRLPNDVLGQVWDLVDGQKMGALAREEFVVGMWLIDQQLKGHKLPLRVPESVWGSVKRIPGITLSQVNLHS